MGKKKHRNTPREPKFETSFGDMMSGLGVKKIGIPKKPTTTRQPGTITRRGTVTGQGTTSASPMTSQDKGEIQQLLNAISDLQQHRRTLQAKVKSQEDALMRAAENAGMLQEKFRNHEAVRLKDLKLMTTQRKELASLRQSNRELLSQRDAIARRLEQKPAPVAPVPVASPPPEGSDVRQAAWTLSAAMTDLNIERLLIVGGSPPYHSQLKTLFSDGLDLRLIEGSERRNLKQARADVSWADLVIVWGGTILDHRLSQLYTGEAVMVVPHRGIIGMMRQVADNLSS